MAIANPRVSHYPTHKTLYQIARPYNGRYLVICQTTTQAECRAWLAYFTQLKPFAGYLMFAPEKGR